MSDRTAARLQRAEQLRALIEQEGLGAVLLRRPANFAWYTGGGDSRVDHASPAGVADILVTPAGEWVITSTIEAERLRAEQTPDIEVIAHPWYESPAATYRRLTEDRPIGADLPAAGEQNVAAAIDELRWVLDAETVARYRAVGADAVDAIEEAAAGLSPGMTEYEAAAALAAACRRRALSTPVLLAAADQRIARYRHPIPTAQRAHQRIMLVVCAERGGLYANLTRFVHFADIDAETRRRLAACETILHRLRSEATRPGRALGEILDDIKRFYADEGFPAEWTLHHQGGLTGYASRELVAMPGSTYRVQPNQAFAWNPSITGAKAEETFLLTADGAELLARAKTPT